MFTPNSMPVSLKSLLNNERVQTPNSMDEISQLFPKSYPQSYSHASTRPNSITGLTAIGVQKGECTQGHQSEVRQSVLNKS